MNIGVMAMGGLVLERGETVDSGVMARITRCGNAVRLRGAMSRVTKLLCKR